MQNVLSQKVIYNLFENYFCAQFKSVSDSTTTDFFDFFHFPIFFVQEFLF